MSVAEKLINGGVVQIRPGINFLQLFDENGVINKMVLIKGRA